MKSFFQNLMKSSTTYVTKEKDKIPRTILKGNQKTQMIQKIEEIVFRAKFEPVSSELEEICEIVHFNVVKDQPVRIDYINKLLPGINFRAYDDSAYNEWLKYKFNMEAQQEEIIIKDSKNSKNQEEDQDFKEANKIVDKTFNQKEFLKQYQHKK